MDRIGNNAGTVSVLCGMKELNQKNHGANTRSKDELSPQGS